MAAAPAGRGSASPEAFIRDWLDLATHRLGLGFAYELLPMGRAIRVTLKALAGATFGERRWVQVASAIQTLLETAVARQGISPSMLEVQVQEAVGQSATDEATGLVAAVRAAALSAAQYGRAFALGPMSVADRRQVHQALSDVAQVWTQSEGEGIFRRLWIIPRQLLPGRSNAPAAAEVISPAVAASAPVEDAEESEDADAVGNK